MSPQTAAEKPPAEEFFLEPPEAASILRLSTITIARMLRAGELPGVIRVRGRYRIRRDQFQAWVDAGCPPIATTTAH